MFGVTQQSFRLFFVIGVYVVFKISHRSRQSCSLSPLLILALKYCFKIKNSCLTNIDQWRCLSQSLIGVKCDGREWITGRLFCQGTEPLEFAFLVWSVITQLSGHATKTATFLVSNENGDSGRFSKFVTGNCVLEEVSLSRVPEICDVQTFIFRLIQIRDSLFEREVL